MSRRLHFVGTLPQFSTADEAMAWQLRKLHDEIRRVTGGETGDRLNWFVPLAKDLMRLPHIRTSRTGEWTDYDDVDRLVLKRGHTLRVADIPLRMADWAEDGIASLDALGTPATPQLPLQIGIPGYLDIALFLFGPVGMFSHATTFRFALARQIERIAHFAGDRVVFQIETPAALVAVASAPTPLRAAVADLMARCVLRQVTLAPRGSRFGLRLCPGDMGHKAKIRLRTAQPVVALANALTRRWPATHNPLEYLHLPLCGGSEPPTTAARFHTPLRRLSHGPARTIVADIAHEDQQPDQQRAVRDRVEDALGREVDIATACGLGRRTPVQARRAVASMRRLLT
ncbi:hypothetical protein AB0K81_27715 [Streptomyces werraensis]|uniref:Uncharacterized protein n=1 Tax=Streptomyces werraensis TaxID=68284 RepID=A0ABV3JPI8_9ACTN